MAPMVHRTSLNEGLAPGFRPLHFREHPSARANDHRSRPDRSPSPSLDALPRFASRRRSDTAPRCLDSASTTDVSRHEHPRRPHLRRAAAARRGKTQPALGSWIASRARRFGRSFERDAGPPRRCRRGHPASDGRVLDGTQTGFRPTSAHAARLRGVNEIAAALSAERTVSPVRAL